MKTDNIIPCILKVTASDKLNIEDDLKSPESAKSLEQLINEQEKEENIEEKN
jgi:hypothetical protein